jgi:hypothetical protein
MANPTAKTLAKVMIFSITTIARRAIPTPKTMANV